jgi:(2Fe-2S) ferredoxin
LFIGHYQSKISQYNSSAMQGGVTEEQIRAIVQQHLASSV